MRPGPIVPRPWSPRLAVPRSTPAARHGSGSGFGRGRRAAVSLPRGTGIDLRRSARHDGPTSGHARCDPRRVPAHAPAAGDAAARPARHRFQTRRGSTHIIGPGWRRPRRSSRDHAPSARRPGQRPAGRARWPVRRTRSSS
jgi:hypothetical protein